MKFHALRAVLIVALSLSALFVVTAAFTLAATAPGAHQGRLVHR